MVYFASPEIVHIVNFSRDATFQTKHQPFQFDFPNLPMIVSHFTLDS